MQKWNNSFPKNYYVIVILSYFISDKKIVREIRSLKTTCFYSCLDERWFYTMKTFLTFFYGPSDVLVKGKYIQNAINLLVKGEFKFEFCYQCSYLK